MEGLVPSLSQWLLFSAALLLVGCVAWRGVVASRAAAELGAAERSELQAAAGRVARTGLVVSLLLIPVWGLRMVVQLMGFRDPFVPLSEDLAFLVGETFWGTVWVAQGALLPLLAGSFWMASRIPARSGVEADLRPGPAWWGGAALVALLAGTLALSSHAMGVQSMRGLAVTADWLHALAAGAWIGSLALILTVGRRSTPGASSVGAQLRSFSPMAVVCVTVLLAMGVFLSWTHLGAVSDLWASSYGRILSLKIVFAGGAFLLGLVNWRRGLPALDVAGGETRVRRQAGAEVLIVAVVLLLTAILTQTPKPGEFGG